MVYTKAGRSCNQFVRRIIDFRPHACFQGRPRPFFCRISPIAQAPIIACSPAFDGGTLPRLFLPLRLHCTWSRASNLSTKTFAFPNSHLGTNVVLHSTK